MRSRPVFLNLWKIALPLPALISILHRITGVIFFLGLPVLLYLYYVLSTAQAIHLHWYALFIIWGLISSFTYHVLAGLRHVVFDFGHIHRLDRARQSAWVVLIVSLIFAIWYGYLLI